LELHSDRFAGTFTPFRIESVPFRNEHLNSLFLSFILAHFSENARIILNANCKCKLDICTVELS